MAETPYYLLDTFAERYKARQKNDQTKAVDSEADEVEDKAVKSTETKKRAAARKK